LPGHDAPIINSPINHNRWYDPSVGKWLSEDPSGFGAGDANLYRYCGNGPTDGTDPSGLEERKVSIIQIMSIKKGEWKNVLVIQTEDSVNQAKREAAERGMEYSSPWEGQACLAGESPPVELVSKLGRTMKDLEALAKQGKKYKVIILQGHGTWAPGPGIRWITKPASGPGKFDEESLPFPYYEEYEKEPKWKELDKKFLEALTVLLEPDGELVFLGCTSGDNQRFSEADLAKFTSRLKSLHTIAQRRVWGGEGSINPAMTAHGGGWHSEPPVDPAKPKKSIIILSPKKWVGESGRWYDTEKGAIEDNRPKEERRYDQE